MRKAPPPFLKHRYGNLKAQFLKIVPTLVPNACFMAKRPREDHSLTSSSLSLLMPDKKANC